MKNILITVYAALLALVLFAGHAAMADSDQYSPPNEMEQSSNSLFTAGELDELLAPIALYPDPLLAQIIPAATFVDQIDSAARYVRQYGKLARIDDQPWDVSVKAIAHYPDLLFMMDQKYDWTVSLGQAYVNQPQDVMDAIQRLRAEAEAAGNLVSTPEQQVTDEGGIISIDPAEPDLIYVPQYDPLAIYIEGSSTGYGIITFGTGFTIGAWLDRDCDWRGHRVYYHGWQGGGWIGRARPNIVMRNNIYINNRNITVNIDRKIMQNDTSRYRGEIIRNVQLHSERTGHLTPPGRVKQAGSVPSGNPSPVRSEITNVYRGRDIQNSQPVSQTGYGGYGSSKEAASYRERGQASRQNMQQFTRQAPAQRQPVSTGKPAQRPAPQAPHQAPAGGVRR